MLTVDEIQVALPPKLRTSVTQVLADQVNAIASDPETGKFIRETFIGYTSVLKDGRFKLEDYAHAAAYVSYKLMGWSNQEAYARTFPQRYQALVARGASAKDISSYVAMYNKNKLVNLLLEQSMIPIWVLNQDAVQKAIETQVDLMSNAKSEMVRMQAANSILMHLRQPQTKQVDVTVSKAETSGMNELRDALSQLARRQLELIEKGATTQEVAHQRLAFGAGDGR